jgi:protein-disulfide isomerase
LAAARVAAHRNKETVVAKKNRVQASKGPDLKVFYGLLLLVAVVGIGWIGYSVATQGSASAAVEPIELSGISNTDSLLAQARGVVVGSQAAPVQVMVFSDFTCPGCRAFAGLVEPQIKQTFVNNDQVRFTYYDFPLGGAGGHRHGFIAARAARCAGDQDRFWEYHDVLFGRQNEWSYSADVPLDLLTDYAGMLELDEGAFRSCLNSDRFADVVTANKILGQRLNVGSTPTVFIGNRSTPDPFTWEAVKAAIEAELGGA